VGQQQHLDWGSNSDDDDEPNQELLIGGGGNDGDEGDTEACPRSPKRLKGKERAPDNAETDDEKKMAMDTSYDGFGIGHTALATTKAWCSRAATTAGILLPLILDAQTVDTSDSPVTKETPAVTASRSPPLAYPLSYNEASRPPYLFRSNYLLGERGDLSPSAGMKKRKRSSSAQTIPESEQIL
jgi:hypothetical protein